MLCLDDVDVQSLLRLEADLNDESLDEFIDVVRNHYGLASLAYLCPSLHGPSMSNSFCDVTYGDARPPQSKNVFVNSATDARATSALPIESARRLREREKVQRLFGGAKMGGAGQQRLTIPVRDPANGLWALFIATSNEDQLDWSARRYELMRDLVHVAHYIHQRAAELREKKTEVHLAAMTARELEALSWCAAGRDVANIAIFMRIGAETVIAHIESARYKLQALNRAHAVAKAILAGLIGGQAPPFPSELMRISAN
jgi:LuxR family quorum-sensing system transcriptional regulator SinR